MPSPSAAEPGASALPRASATYPEDGGAYDSCPDGSAPRLDPRKSVSTVDPADMSDLDDTATVPGTDQPPGPLAATWPLTASENVTFTCVRDTAVAFVMTGGWPSSRDWR